MTKKEPFNELVANSPAIYIKYFDSAEEYRNSMIGTENIRELPLTSGGKRLRKSRLQRTHRKKKATRSAAR